MRSPLYFAAPVILGFTAISIGHAQDDEAPETKPGTIRKEIETDSNAARVRMINTRDSVPSTQGPMHPAYMPGMAIGVQIPFGEGAKDGPQKDEAPKEDSPPRMLRKNNNR